jgi:hypothetical protein
MANAKKLVVAGIADINGIESINQVEKMGAAPFVLRARAASNRGRNAVVFFAQLTLKQAQAVADRASNGDCLGALRLLKTHKVSIEEGMEELWNAIPC